MFYSVRIQLAKCELLCVCACELIVLLDTNPVSSLGIFCPRTRLRLQRLGQTLSTALRATGSTPTSTPMSPPRSKAAPATVTTDNEDTVTTVMPRHHLSSSREYSSGSVRLKPPHEAAGNSCA